MRAIEELPSELMTAMRRTRTNRCNVEAAGRMGEGANKMGMLFAIPKHQVSFICFPVSLFLRKQLASKFRCERKSLEGVPKRLKTAGGPKHVISAETIGIGVSSRYCFCGNNTHQSVDANTKV